MRAAAPHELCQAEQVLQVVARLPFAYSDLRADLLRAGGPQVERVVCGGDVQHCLNRMLVFPLREEINHFGAVATADCLAHIEVLEGLLYLGACHLERDTPCARL